MTLKYVVIMRACGSASASAVLAMSHIHTCTWVMVCTKWKVMSVAITFLVSSGAQHVHASRHHDFTIVKIAMIMMRMLVAQVHVTKCWRFLIWQSTLYLLFMLQSPNAKIELPPNFPLYDVSVIWGTIVSQWNVCYIRGPNKSWEIMLIILSHHTYCNVHVCAMGKHKATL